MYISNVFIRNFKSLKSVSFALNEGKNVIVGKNNSGKSNIITSLDILFGSKNPNYIEFDDSSYHTYKQIDTDSGEIAEKVADYFYIHAELKGDNINHDEILKIKKKVSFSKIGSPKNILHKDSHFVDFDFFSNLDELDNSEHIVSLPENYNRKTQWFNKDEVITLLTSSKKIIVFFCKQRLSGASGYGLIIVDKNNACWISHFMRNEIRNALLTTAIIPAFRTPKDELRLVHYSWYGKLIKSLWNSGKEKVEEEIQIKSDEIKKLADKVFEDSTLEIRNLLKNAISHKSVSFKLLSNQKNEIYKNIQIHIDDGIDRPIDQKGSGIQSAIIISLFTSYCTNFHQSSSLLVTEEPELFLHPQARRVISGEFGKYLNGSNKSQLIVSTHSTEFVKNVPISNIVIASKITESNETCVKQISYDDNLTKEEVQKIVKFIWSKNTEIFFADKVILVEGGEEYLIPNILDCLAKSNQFLDYKNISVARVDGKGNFITYAKILDRLNIPWVILGDLDCFDDIVLPLMEHLKLDTTLLKSIKEKSTNQVSYKKIKKEVIKNTDSRDGHNLARLFKDLKNQEIQIDDPELIEFIDYLENRFSKSSFSELISNDDDASKEFASLQSMLRENNIFILDNGAIESYYTEEAKDLPVKGKDNRALEIATIISKNPEQLTTLLKDIDVFIELLKNLNNQEPDYVLSDENQ